MHVGGEKLYDIMYISFNLIISVCWNVGTYHYIYILKNKINLVFYRYQGQYIIIELDNYSIKVEVTI